MTRKAPVLDLEGAETIALKALTFLAEDMPRLGRFLALTGIGPSELAAGAATAGMQAAVLDHLLSDESLLLVFSAQAGLQPQQIGYAHALLAREQHLRGDD
ncbi:MAG: DUF3572 domain-containing protein [Hyphomicrobium sp.]|nr:DUF3572 domain-containing protein [Hyphomicrobium sp.]PPC83940.1 MAG: hypothetical protein CTY40_00970 [Hyphomicrobium sp.]